MNNHSLAQKGICTLCPTCSLNTHSHYLDTRLIISYCECRKMGGLHVGFGENPYWKLYADIDKDEFLALAKSADMYVSIMKESNSQQHSI